MSKESYIEALKDGIAKLRAAGREVTLVHHNDADGLTAGGILETALTRDGFNVERIALERIHPPIVERIHDRAAGHPVVYTDLAGRAAPVICDLNRDRSFTLILDHQFVQFVGTLTPSRNWHETGDGKNDNEVFETHQILLVAVEVFLDF